MSLGLKVAESSSDSHLHPGRRDRVLGRTEDIVTLGQLAAVRVKVQVAGRPSPREDDEYGTKSTGRRARDGSWGQK